MWTIYSTSIFYESPDTCLGCYCQLTPAQNTNQVTSFSDSQRNRSRLVQAEGRCYHPCNLHLYLLTLLRDVGRPAESTGVHIELILTCFRGNNESSHQLFDWILFTFYPKNWPAYQLIKINYFQSCYSWWWACDIITIVFKHECRVRESEVYWVRPAAERAAIVLSLYTLTQQSLGVSDPLYQAFICRLMWLKRI